MSTPSTSSALTAGEVAKRCGVPTWQLLAAIRRKFLPEPSRVAFFRVWSETDLPRVRAALIAGGYLDAEEVAADAK